MKYQFNAFEYDATQKLLSHDEKTVEMPKKCHQLLQYLLENPNTLVTKESLIDHVWNGRVVTSNTIDQCIMKLRKVLKTACDDDYIESVYGQGIRFLPNTSSECSQLEQPTVNEPHGASRKLEWVIMAAAIGSLMLYFLLKQPPNDPMANSQPITAQTTTSSNPTANRSKDLWVHTGSRAYLNHLFNRYPSLHAQKAQVIETKELQPALNVVITTHNNSPADFSMSLSSLEKSNDRAYSANLMLRINDEVVASKQFQDSQLTTLYTAGLDWLAKHQDIVPAKADTVAEVFTKDDQALKTYFKAMSAQANGDSNQALTFLQAAVEQDPTFKMAWFEMAVASRKQGDPRKAIGILNALSTDESQLAYRITLVKAQCHDSLAEYSKAEQLYDKALVLAENSQDPSKIAAVYISQAILYRKTQQYEQAKLALDQATLVTDSRTQPQLYGTIMNTYAKLARNNNQPLLAIEKAELAIEAFQRSGDLRYQMQAKTVLASILRLRNEFNKAEQLVKESLFHAEQLNNQRGISDNRTKLARLYQQTGRFKLAHEQWQSVLVLNTVLELPANTADAYLWLLRLHLNEGKTALAAIDLKMINQLFNEHASEEIRLLLLEAQMIMSLHQEDLAASQRHLMELMSVDHPMAQVYQADVALLEQQYAAAELHYLEALYVVNTTGRLDLMVDVLNRLNALYLIHNTHKLKENLLRTARLKPFIYPLQKFQAQAAINDNNHIKALGLMEELKLKAGGFWQQQDQLLLERMKNQQE